MSSGCADPFTVERHTLGPPRLAALGVHDGMARAAVWSGSGPVHAERPELQWTLNGAFIGDGFDVPVEGDGLLEVVVGLPNGQTLDGQVTVGSWVPLSVVRQVVDRPADLSLDGRRTATAPEPRRGSAARDELVRLTATRTNGTIGQTRWMLGRDDWTVLELHEDSADAVAAKVTFDDGVVDTVVEGDPGTGPLLVLSVDGRGNNGWQWVDVAFGMEEPLLDVGGWLLAVGPDRATDAVLSAEPGDLTHIVATLEVSATAEPSKAIGVVDVEAGTDLATDLAAFPSPDCADPGEPFALWALAEGRCAADEVNAARVVLELP